MSEQHRFECHLRWTGAGANAPLNEPGPVIGANAFTYDSYSRDLRVSFIDKPALEMSGAPAFKGDLMRHNPEDLMMAALSACHALTYLAVAARSRIEVLAYEDRATGILAKIDGPMRFTEATLHPRVTVKAGTDLARAKELHAKAHQNCFIAQSVNFPVHIEPVIIEG
jgi:organic hydroperoxide reductase OsmC/OhrA